MAAARESVCVPYVERMRPALLRQFGGDASLVEKRVAELIAGCAAAEAKKDARLGECVAAAFRDAQAECAARECREAVAACAARLCDVHVWRRRVIVSIVAFSHLGRRGVWTFAACVSVLDGCYLESAWHSRHNMYHTAFGSQSSVGE